MTQIKPGALSVDNKKGTGKELKELEAVHTVTCTVHTETQAPNFQ